MSIRRLMEKDGFIYSGHLTDSGVDHMKNLDMLINSDEACCYSLNQVIEFDFLISYASDEQLSQLKYTVFQ